MSILVPMSTTRLSRILHGSHGEHFLGVFAMDQLPSSLPRNDDANGYCLIVNTDPASLPGTHWLAVWIDPTKREMGEVFDSYGRPPPLPLQKWLGKFTRKWTYSKRFVQGPISLLCGIYCLFVLHRKCHYGQSFNETVDKQFTDVADKNDFLMLQYMKKMPL